MFPSRFFGPNADDSLATLLEISESIGAKPAQVALRWVLSQPAVTAVIVGSRNSEQFRENLDTADLVLAEDHLQRLTEVSQLPDRYPESMEKNMKERRSRAVK